MKDKNILLISPEKWSHLFISKHHYAIHLAQRGNRVFFLNPPLNTFIRVEQSGYQNVKVIYYSGFIPGLRFLPAVIQRFLIRRKFNEIEKVAKCKFDIIWSFDNSVFFDFSALPSSVFAISHIVDLNQDFQFKRASKSADLCLGVIPAIVEKHLKYNKHAYLVPHAVNERISKSRYIHIPGDNSIRAMYAGNLDMPHIDWVSLNKLALKNLSVDFIFLGSKKGRNTERETFLSLPNVFFIGKIPYSDLQLYYRSADILLLCYREEYFENYASPHKILEYLLSGRLIYSNWIEEYSSLFEKGYIQMFAHTDEVEQHFSSIINDLDYWNSNKKFQDRIDYAKERTYNKRICKIEKYYNDINSNSFFQRARIFE